MLQMASSSPQTSLKSILGRFGQFFNKTKGLYLVSSAENRQAELIEKDKVLLVRPKIPLGNRWNTVQISVSKDDEGRQVSDVICKRYVVSRPLVQRFLREGKINVMRAPKIELQVEHSLVPEAEVEKVRKITPRQNMRVEAGDLVTMSEVLLTPKPQDSLPKFDSLLTEKGLEWIRKQVLYKDEDIIVLNKPTGLAVHGGPKIQEHLDGLLNGLKFDMETAPLIVHRLDRDTSGVLILARTKKVAKDLASRLKDNFLDQTIEKTYWAMVRGVPRKDQRQGEIVSNVYQVIDNKDVRMTTFAERRRDLLDEGKPAVTQYRWMQLHKRLEPKIKLSLMELKPLTGRTHQLRIHMAEQLGLPILGDYKYFPNQEAGLKMHLHCYRIQIKHWLGKGKHLLVTAPIPEHFVETMYRVPLKLDEPPKHVNK